MYDGDLAMLGDSVNLINCGCKEWKNDKKENWLQ
jgi:hypothetical protein